MGRPGARRLLPLDPQLGRTHHVTCVGANRAVIGSQCETEGRPVRALPAGDGERVLEVLEDVLVPRARDDEPVRGKREINASP